MSKTWTKRELINRISKQIDEKPIAVEKIVSATFTTLREVLSEANPEVRIEIRDFGVLEVKKARAIPKSRNPRTGEEVYVPERRKTHFKPGKLLKDEMKKKILLIQSIIINSPNSMKKKARRKKQLNVIKNSSTSGKRR